MAGVNNYKDGVVTRLYRGLQGLIKSRDITVVEGEGRLVGPRTVAVGGDAYTGTDLILASGSYSRTLPGLTIDGERVITSEHALELDRVPGSVIVLGGGVIGCEFASIWKSFGTEVTIVEALPHLVPLEDEASSKLLERAFRRRKINFKLDARFERVEHTDSGVRVLLEGGETLEAELLLVAVGRGPTSDGLGYEEYGVDARSRVRRRGRVLPDQRSTACTRSATSCRRSSSRTSASRRASWSPSTSPVFRSSRSTTRASRASPTPTPKWRRSG